MTQISAPVASKESASKTKSFFTKMYVQVLIAIGAGIILGQTYPSLATQMKPLSDGFITLVRSVVPVIVFASIALGIAKMNDVRRVGAVGIRALVYFEVLSTLALLFGLVVGNLFQPGAGLHIDPATLDTKLLAGYVEGAKSLTIIDFLLKMIPSNMIGAIAQGDLLPIIIMALLFGFSLCHLGDAGKQLVRLLDAFTNAMFGMVRMVMYVAPLAAFGAMAFTVGKFGFATLNNLAQLVAAVYLTSLLFVIVGFGIVAQIFHLRLWRIIKYFKDELLIAFSATSGEAMIPQAIMKLRRLGCSDETVGLVLPAGFTFNTDGTAIYMTLSVLFIAQVTGIQLTINQQLTMLFVMLFTSKGAAGIAGAGFVALAATIPMLGVLPIGGLTLLLGVERFMSEIRAVTNLFSNVFATVVVSKWMGELDDEHVDHVLLNSE